MKLKKKERKEYLKTFFDLANKNFKNMQDSELVSFIFSYTSLLEAFKQEFSYEDLANRTNKMLNEISSGDGEKGAKKIKNLFDKLQQHLKKMLHSIIQGKQGEKDEGPVVSVLGSMKVNLDFENDCFVSYFTPENTPGKFDLPSEKDLLNILFLALLKRYKLKSSHFVRCHRSKCNNFFYKYSTSSLYCSSKCSNAATQSTYRKKRKKQLHSGKE